MRRYNPVAASRPAPPRHAAAAAAAPSADGSAFDSEALVAPAQVRGINCGQIGPELGKLRAAQGEHMEYYTMEHYNRLYGWRRAWNREAHGGKQWCKDVHGPGCTEVRRCRLTSG